MKSILLLLILAASVFIALIVQDLLPPLSGFKNAHILLIPVFFSYGALVLPFPAVLIFAAFTGLITDLSIVQIVNGKVEIWLGSSIFIYTALGTIMQGVRGRFFKGAWWLHPHLSALCTFLVITLQYLIISLRRESLVFNEVVLWKILIPTVIAFLLSPAVELLFIYIERALPNFRGYQAP